MKTKILCIFMICASSAWAGMQDRPGGIKIGQRMTLRPYVSLDYTYDSNIDMMPDGSAVSQWAVNPGLNLDYKAEKWNLSAGVFYRHLGYNKYVNRLDEDNYGENLTFNWSTSEGGSRGWSLMLSESFKKISEDDDMTKNNGLGMWRSRQEFNANAVLQRRFNDRFHGDVNASYYYLDYDRNDRKYASLYGWDRWTVGLEAGYAFSKWFDLLVAGSYQGYTQENTHDIPPGGGYRRYADDSDGWTLHGGFGSYFTERISYRVMTGWTHFSYSGDAADCDGWTYSVSGNWLMTDRWNMSLLASSYYQPSEREYGCANRVDMISWGISHSMIRGKLLGSFDLAYRIETMEYSSSNAWGDTDEDIYSARFGLTYMVNRFLSVYGRVEYQGCNYKRAGADRDYDYDRFRGTIGIRLTY